MPPWSCRFVSIPERVWGGLEPLPSGRRSPSKRFQSLRGFGVGWSSAPCASTPAPPTFQSLRGFGVGWSPPAGVEWRPVPAVSIPERVWGGLERAIFLSRRLEQFVSIPERVWGGLEPANQQSASTDDQVSIPERVWGGLELGPHEGQPIGRVSDVSIPERVWGGLERLSQYC